MTNTFLRVQESIQRKGSLQKLNSSSICSCFANRTYFRKHASYEQTSVCN